MTYNEMLTVYDEANRESAKALHRLDSGITALFAGILFLLTAIGMLLVSGWVSCLAAVALACVLYLAAEEQRRQGLQNHERAMSLYASVVSEAALGSPSIPSPANGAK